jgi:hypothetical protein
MRRILWAVAVTALCAPPLTAQAGEPRRSLVERGRGVVQTCFHRKCDRSGCYDRCDKGSWNSCTASCSPCGEDDIRIGKLIDTLFYAERACDRKNAALRLDRYDWTEHPEIVTALTHAMQSDCERCVRIAAADSLKDMRVSDPDSIGAMQFTRLEDPSCRVRYKAKWGIIKGEKCRPPCLTYVSGYAQPVLEADEMEPPATPLPRLQPMPSPEQKPLNGNGTGVQAKRGVRSLMSSAMAKVRSRS